MKNILLLLFLLLSYQSINAQKNGTITYKAYFAKSEATDELYKKNIQLYQEIKEEEMMARDLTFNLDFNDNESLFYLSKSIISEFQNQDSKEYVIGMFYGYDKIYINKKEDRLIEQLYYSFGTLLKKRKASLIEWKLTSETKKINNYKCYKATYTYIQKWRGREFPWEITAWYCPKIPVQFGPIRYSGLPGLILELSENNKGFIVDKITFLEKSPKIKEPSKGEVLTEEEIDKRHKKAKEQLSN